MDLSKIIRVATAKIGGQKIVALKLGISEPELSRKLSGERGWKLAELQELFKLVELNVVDEDGNVGDLDLIMELSRKLSESMRMVKEMGEIIKEKGGELK